MDTLLLIKALLLGIVEGLTEFLPISSTGHLIIAASLLDFTGERAKTFEIVIQLGAILAICWEYRRRIGQTVVGMRAGNAADWRFSGQVLLAFTPAVILGLLFHDVIKSVLFNPVTVAAALIAGGLVILWVEGRAHTARVETLESLRWRDALKIGLAQCLALFPGVSRAGATIIGGLYFGLSRRAATEFSFFLAIPTMIGATAYDLYKNWSLLSAGDLPMFALGFLAAFLSALVAVKVLVRFVSSHSFRVFAWYRIVFGSAILVTAYTGWIHWQAQ
jgi:undecaprenyl-diphosphatase